MLRKAVIAALVVVGAGLAFSGLLHESAGPRATFTLDAQQLRWLTGQPGLSFAMTESGARDVPDAVNACYAERTVRFQSDGSAPTAQVCIDDESRRYDDAVDARWHIDGATLCLDTRPLDRDPACWHVIYRNGTLEFENPPGSRRWTATVEGAGTPRDVLAALREVSSE